MIEDRPDIADHFTLLILMGSFLLLILLAGLIMEYRSQITAFVIKCYEYITLSRMERRAKNCRHRITYLDADNYVRCRDCETHSNDFEI